MRADLDTLVITRYVTIDELLGPRRGPGHRPKLSDAELVCLAVAQVLLGVDSERRWLEFAGQRLGHLFPYLPTPSAYNRRLRRTAALVCLAIQDLTAHTPSFCDQLRLIDSTPVPCAASRQTVQRSALAGTPAMATARAATATSGAFGCMCWPPDGLPVAWCLATPKLGEREVVAALLDQEHGRLRPGLLILADTGFAGRDFEQLVTGYGAALLRPDRADEPRRRGSLGRWRQWIESAFNTSRTSWGWNATGDEPWPASMSGSRNDSWPWPPPSGGTGRPAPPTSVPWSPTTTTIPSTKSEAII